MGRPDEMRPVMRPADIRRAVTEWASQGFAVKVDPDGTISVTPPQRHDNSDPFDQLDFRA